MRPLLQHASRSLTIARPSVASLLALDGFFQRSIPSLCSTCQHRGVTQFRPNHNKAQLSWQPPTTQSRRHFSSSARRTDDKKPLVPIPPKLDGTTPPAANSKSEQESHIEERVRNILLSQARERPREEVKEPLPEKSANDQQAQASGEVADNAPLAQGTEQVLQQKPTAQLHEDGIADNVSRVPDEHLPSHRERQRWDFSKRLSELMDDLLPKLAVVTQKVNTFTGTDYSGIEALRREIKDQESLVKARRAAIDSAKHILDTAHSKQASAQKEVVALLERKHSWSAGDLERYMALIRSEHVNDQAVREAKEAVFNAESALEEARTRLEKRERAQYHEEQIWSDTIRRNSTWVTFVLMGVNIFLLLLSLLILEPWRRRRMVREIKTALEAQKVPVEVSSVPVTSPIMAELAAIEEAIDSVIEPEATLPTDTRPTTAPITSEQAPSTTKEAASITETTPLEQPNPEPVLIADIQPPSQEPTTIIPAIPPAPQTWTAKATAVAQDVFSDRVISMRRIDFTTAILQGAAAGAVITASLIAMSWLD